MAFSKILLPNRGTKLYKNSNEIQRIRVKPKDSKILPPPSELMYVAGNKIGRFSSIRNDDELTLTIHKNQEYMIINLSEKSIKVDFTIDPINHIEIFDPYMIEDEPHKNIDVEEFKKSHNVPDGYIDVLAKWYSIKFNYPKVSYIYLKPGLGISLQIHKMRSEVWEIGLGNPIIIADTKITYDTKKGDTFNILKETLHSIINPSNEWVLVKEKFTGKFDELDIERIFNPNNYR